MNATTLKDNLIAQFRNKMAHLFVVLKDPMWSFRAGNLIVTFRMIDLCFNNFDRNIGGDAL